MSHVVKKEQCPKCAKIGKDRRGDNLAIYSDGHQWCFACGYYIPGDALYKLRENKTEVIATALSLPEDIEPALGGLGWEWLHQYKITPEQVYKHRIYWSEHTQQLIFPCFIQGELICWNARQFSKQARTKYITKGNIKDTLWIIPGQNKNKLIFTEDVVSSIVTSRQTDTSPLLGTHIPDKKIFQASQYYTEVYIWLDPDKKIDSIKQAERFRKFGINCKSILSDKDPKECHETIISC